MYPLFVDLHANLNIGVLYNSSNPNNIEKGINEIVEIDHECDEFVN